MCPCTNTKAVWYITFSQLLKCVQSSQRKRKTGREMRIVVGISRGPKHVVPARPLPAEPQTFHVTETQTYLFITVFLFLSGVTWCYCRTYVITDHHMNCHWISKHKVRICRICEIKFLIFCMISDWCKVNQAMSEDYSVGEWLLMYSKIICTNALSQKSHSFSKSWLSHF